MTTPNTQKSPYVDFEALGLKPLGQCLIKRTADIQSSRIGVGFETLDRYMFNPEKVYPWLAELGAKWARVQTGWSRCETEKGVYDFAWLDRVVDQILAAGVQPFFSVTYGNQLYMDVPHVSAVGCVPLYFGDEARQAWLNFVHALADHYQGRVAFWEIWNEPNITPFWFPKPPSPRDYTELVRITSTVIRHAIPSAKIIGVSTCGLSPQFMEQALLAGLAEWIDICAFHPYQAVPEDNLQNMHDGIRRLLDLHAKGKHIPIWQGENGCASQKESHQVFHIFDMDETIQAKWVARRILIDLKINFDRSFYFHVADLVETPYFQSADKPSKPMYMGLLRGGSYQPKPSFHVFQRLCSLFDDQSRRAELFYKFLHIHPENPQQSGLLAAPVAATFIRNGCPVLAYWLSENPQCRAPVTELDIAFWWDADLSLTQPVLLDIMTGHYYDISHLGTPKDGGLQFRLPLADYPLVLTDLRALEP